MQYDVYVQNKFYKTITTDNGYSVNAVFRQIEADRTSGNLVVDSAQPISVRIVEHVV